MALLLMLLTVTLVTCLTLKKKWQAKKNNTKVIETMVPLKYQSNFWSTVEIPLINCESNLI